MTKNNAAAQTAQHTNSLSFSLSLSSSPTPLHAPP